MAEDGENDAGTATTGKVFTYEEVKTHNSSESLWVIIHDKVYDVTKFKEEVGHREPIRYGATRVVLFSKASGWGGSSSRARR